MKRSGSMPSSWLFVALVLAASAAAGPAKLRSADDILGLIDPPEAKASATSAAESDAATLLADIVRYRQESGSLAPVEAAKRWFALFDRAARATPPDQQNDFAAYDLVTMRAVGVRSVMAALPPPTAWQELRQEAVRRAARGTADREALSVRFIAELLARDHVAALETLDALDKLLADLPADAREISRQQLLFARTAVIKTYGSPADIAAAFETQLRAIGQPYGILEVPDLVGLVGEQRANSLLSQAIAGDTTMRIESGDATRKLARRLALENIATMRVPQWMLADSVDSAPLYEAIEKRFDPASADSAQSTESAQSQVQRDYRSSEATAWYFLASVIGGKQTDAERALVRMTQGSEVYIPRDAVRALQRAGQNEALFRFLHAQLDRRPEIGAWNVYVEQASYTGHSAEALALIEKILARKSLPEFLVADLKVRRVSALLAADKIDAAAEGLRSLLAKPPARGEGTLAARYEAALKAAALGRLTGRRDLGDIGLRFAQAALPLMPDNASRPDLNIDQTALWRELRKAGRASDAQSLAIASLTKAGPRTGFQTLAPASPAERAALVELAGIWSAEGKHDDVLKLLDVSTRWNAVDAGALLAVTDSERLPMGVMLARALQARGDKEGALRVARATVSQLPGTDAGYELVAALDPAALTTFDAMFAHDQYEERPLIWKAAVQIKAGAIADAETTIRRAISIDPSDGEQGVNDRMRAYAVLADILERKGDTAGAAIYSKAVQAIRISETADSYYEAGMYERAFKGYREALEQFSDAYCIQSRLAVQLNKVGRRTEALEHYRRAYELMPDSFGRVESHCFGCESVFQGDDAQSVAEQVFTDVVRKSPAKAQAYYLLAYLREQQERYADAVQPLRQAVSLDPQYLNAWMHLYQAGSRTWIEPGELDIARLKLQELDPLRRHGQYDLSAVGDLAGLWRGAERAYQAAQAAQPIRGGVYPLRANADLIQKTRAALPEEMRSQLEMYERLTNYSIETPTAQALLSQHSFVNLAIALMGGEIEPRY